MENTATSPSPFVFVATDAAGQRRYVESNGDNVGAARYRLEVQGFTEIEVIKDALDANLDRAIASEAFDGMTLHEKMEFERRCAGPEADRFVAWQTIKSEAVTIVLLATWVWFRASGPTPWSMGSWAAYACVLGYLGLLIRIRVPGKLYNRLLEARAWHRWDVVEATVKKIRRWQWATGKLIPEFELLFSEARVEAGRGELATALEKVKPLENDPSFDRGLYYGLLGSLYDIAHDIPGCIDAAEKALALDPKSTTARIELASVFALHARRPDRAREVLTELAPEDVKPMAQPYLDLVCGIIALDDGRTVEAEKQIAIAVEGWSAFAGNPLAKSMARMLQGYHAVALRRIGRTDEAEEKFGEVRAFLEATDDRNLLRRWSDV